MLNISYPSSRSWGFFKKITLLNGAQIKLDNWARLSNLSFVQLKKIAVKKDCSSITLYGSLIQLKESKYHCFKQGDVNDSVIQFFPNQIEVFGEIFELDGSFYLFGQSLI